MAKRKTAGEYVIELFGGTRPLAKALGCDPVTVYRWQPWPKNDPTGNLSGSIPAKWHKKLLDLAKKKKVELTVNHLIEGR